MQYYLPYTGPDSTPGLLRTYVSDGYQQAYRASVDLTALPIQEQPYTQGRRRILILDEHRNVKGRRKTVITLLSRRCGYSGDFSVGVGGTTPRDRSRRSQRSGNPPQRGYWLQGSLGQRQGSGQPRSGQHHLVDWEYERRHYSSPYYDYNSTVYNDNGHAWLRISATFTIGYGKELRRGNEVGSKGEVDKGALEVD